MTRRRDRIISEWADDNRRLGYRRRDWRRGYILAALCVTLLVAGLAAELWIGSARLAMICWIGAAVAVVALLTRFYDRRSFLDR